MRGAKRCGRRVAYYNSGMRHALITGCSSGIGRYCALALARQKQWRVFAAVRRPQDARLLQEDGIADVILLDLDDSASIAQAVREVLNKTAGRLEVLFNNAAYGQPGATEDLTREALRAQFETNVFGTQELTNTIIPLMRKNGGGRIVQNSSVLGYVCMKYRGAYNASKYALEALTDTMRLELAGSGVYVSLLEPGPIVSAFRQNATNAFIRHIDRDNSVHRTVYEKMAEQRHNTVPFTLGPEAVHAAFMRAITDTRPQPRYRITVPAVAFWYLKRALPVKWLDTLLART